MRMSASRIVRREPRLPSQHVREAPRDRHERQSQRGATQKGSLPVVRALQRPSRARLRDLHSAILLEISQLEVVSTTMTCGTPSRSTVTLAWADFAERLEHL